MLPDFSRPTTNNNFEMVVDGRSFFVNPSQLCQWSSVFAKFMYRRCDRPILKDCLAEEFLEFLRVACHLKAISVDNFLSLTNTARKFQIDSLRSALVDFFEQHASSVTMEVLAEMISASVALAAPNKVLSQLVRQAGKKLDISKETTLPKEVLAAVMHVKQLCDASLDRAEATHDWRERRSCRTGSLLCPSCHAHGQWFLLVCGVCLNVACNRCLTSPCSGKCPLCLESFFCRCELQLAAGLLNTCGE